MKAVVISNRTEGGFDIRLVENNEIVLKSGWAPSRQSALICAQQLVDEAHTIEAEFGEESQEILVTWHLEEKASVQTLRDISNLLHALHAQTQHTLKLLSACKKQAIGNQDTIHWIHTTLQTLEYEFHRCNEKA